MKPKESVLKKFCFCKSLVITLRLEKAVHIKHLEIARFIYEKSIDYVQLYEDAASAENLFVEYL